jgi:low temperature requirement protein LtrA
MVGRDREEAHRAATTLELFFDLCFVVAIALNASNLHHEVIEGHIGDGVLAYSFMFFAIWLAWLNYTWFASAFDTDDAVYRLMTFVQMSGALVLAAGIPRVFDDTDLALGTAGYVIMRLAMVGHWLRAAYSDPEHRPVALRFAGGVTVLQVLWVARLALHGDAGLAAFVVLGLCELAIPVWAERAGHTTWHRRHITERYGLFTIIVLGESLLAATIALQTAFDAGFADVELLSIAICGMVIVFAMWWLYFEVEENRLLSTDWGAFWYGYGHLPIFAAAAAVGAGVQVLVEHETGHGHISHFTASISVTLPVALYVMGVWAVGILPNTTGVVRVAYPVCAVLVLGFTGFGAPVPITAFFLAALVAVLVLTDHHRQEAMTD